MKLSGGDILVFNCDDQRAPELFHGMKAAEHMHFLQCITTLRNVEQDCVAANISAGKLYSLEASEQGSMQIIHINNCAFFC